MGRRIRCARRLAAIEMRQRNLSLSSLCAQPKCVEIRVARENDTKGGSFGSILPLVRMGPLSDLDSILLSQEQQNAIFVRKETHQVSHADMCDSV